MLVSLNFLEQSKLREFLRAVALVLKHLTVEMDHLISFILL